jgi:hypothetical protein
VVKKFDNKKVGLTAKELSVLARLDTPQKIQTYVSAIPQNFERDGDSCMSVREVLRTNRALCMEGALLAALALWVHGDRPLILDLSAANDDDHVIAVFKRGGLWGAISKGNHPYVRYRDPVYRTLRELVMSYFHEYYNLKGEKTLRSYSRLVDLSVQKPESWIVGGNAWTIAELLCDIRHYLLIPKSSEKQLRQIEDIEKRLMNIRNFSK